VPRKAKISASMPAFDPATAFPDTELRNRWPTLGPRALSTVRQIKASAQEALRIKGYADTTIEDIADLAKVSRPTFYTYFRNKDEIMLALIGDALAAVTSVLRHVDAVDVDSTDSVRSWVEDYIAVFDEHAGVLAVVSREQPEIEGLTPETRQSWARWRTRHVARLFVKAHGDAASERFALVVSTMIDHVWLLKRLKANEVPYNADELVDTFVAVIEAIIARAPHRLMDASTSA
jgi:AcrR family transcriptional regulator